MKIKSKLKKSFTMAEILLSLTIIGVVAAITLPSLTGNINEKTWNTQRKALYARMSQAISLMPALNGYGQYSGSYIYDNGSESVSVTADTAAMTFVTDGLSKVLKINNICDSSHLQDCGITSSLKALDGTNLDTPKNLTELNKVFTSSFVDGDTVYKNPQLHVNTQAAGFETINGESILAFYNPFCQPKLGEVSTYYPQPKMCANFIYDLNGLKGPNTVGKDIGFITALYSTDPAVVAPMPLPKNAKDASSGNLQLTYQDAIAICKTQSEDSRLPNVEELSSMLFNDNLIGLRRTPGGPNGTFTFWSSTLQNPTQAWFIWVKSGDLRLWSIDRTRSVRCIRR